MNQLGKRDIVNYVIFFHAITKADCCAVYVSPLALRNWYAGQNTKKKKEKKKQMSVVQYVSTCVSVDVDVILRFPHKQQNLTKSNHRRSFCHTPYNSQ